MITASQSQKSKSDYGIITQMLQTKENVIVICEGKVEEIQKRPLCIFNPQFFDGLKEYFGPSFVIPRTIPFRNREQIKVTLCDNSILFNGSRSSFRMPLFFTYIRHYKQSDELTFSFTIGEFKFVSSHNDTLLYILNTALLIRSQLVHKFENGMLFQNDSKTINIYYSQLTKYSKHIRDSYLFSDVAKRFPQEIHQWPKKPLFV